MNQGSRGKEKENTKGSTIGKHEGITHVKYYRCSVIYEENTRCFLSSKIYGKVEYITWRCTNQTNTQIVNLWDLKSNGSAMGFCLTTRY